MPLNALVTLVRARLYAKGVKARRPLPTLPHAGLGSWDRPDDDHLLQAAVRLGAGRIVTSEAVNLHAAPDVRRALQVEVIGIAPAQKLAERECPGSNRERTQDK